jgi:dTDP-4-dehydrorhamnose reductase
MKILLLGSRGQLGTTLLPQLGRFGDVEAYDHDGIDLADASVTRRRILEIAPDLIINAAAYTAVDKAESEPQAAARVNADAPGVVAECASELGAGLIHYSTDYVFDGNASSPYKEDDPTNPQSVYGRTKLDGENAVLNSGASALILRTAWVYSLHGHNFLKTMLRLAAERDELTIVADQVGSPTSTLALTDATIRLIEYFVEHDGFPPEVRGVYNMTCEGETSWAGFARAIIAASNDSDTRVTDITTADYPTPAARPAYSVLRGDKLDRVFGIRLPDWEDALDTCMAGQ